jgi:hypothetical protein
MRPPSPLASNGLIPRSAPLLVVDPLTQAQPRARAALADDVAASAGYDLVAQLTGLRDRTPDRGSASAG